MPARMTLVLAALIGLVTLAAGQDAKTPGAGKGKAKSELEKALEKALAINPDLKVAQAKVREAQAQLSRTRMEVVQKVVIAYQNIQAEKALVNEFTRRLDGMKRLRSMVKNAVTDDDFHGVEAQLASAKAKLDKAQAELDLLTGKSLARLGVAVGDFDADGFPDLFVTGSDTARALAALALAVRARPEAKGPAADRIRKALQKKVTLKLRGIPAHDVLELLRKEAGDLHIQASTREPVWKEEITANLVDVSFAAALQLLEDTLGGYRVVVRDYGLLIVPESRVPRGAMTLSDFLARKPEASGAAANVPANKVEGKVLRIERNLATLSVGAAAGLAKGHTLHVYRLGATPHYLGQLRIVEVTPTEAVGQVVGEPKDKIQVGDQVSSSLAGRR